jgi:hypothetical protein
MTTFLFNFFYSNKCQTIYSFEFNLSLFVFLLLSLVALGTETDGSIGKPSQRNSLVGMKPTVGLTSRYLVIPLSERQDSVGPMAKTVKDAGNKIIITIIIIIIITIFITIITIIIIIC